MSTTHKIPTWVSTGTGRQAQEEIQVEVQAGSIVGDAAGFAGSALEVRSEAAALVANDLVYISGWSETHALPLVTKADANAAGRQAQFVCRGAIAQNTNGVVYTAFRTAANVNTNAVTSAGDPVYLSETAGGWTETAPTAVTSTVQIVGHCAIKSATVGVIEFDLRDFPTINRNDLQADLIDGTKIADDAVDSEHFAAGSIDTEHYAANSVDLAALAADTNTWLNAIRTYLNDGLLATGTITVSVGDATDFKTTTIAAYNIGGVTYTKAATDSLSFSAADTINTAAGAGTLWGIWLVQINAAGTISTKPGAVDMTYANEAAAIAALPAVDASNVQIGYITVQALEATDWVANTDNLTVGGGAGNCTARSFYNLPAAKTLPAALS